jgi:diguanylate cyclase (GGDEF)-like protein/PAS domain S-box-containing protein
MEQREALFESLLENIRDGVYFVDTDLRIQYWNKAAEELSGYSRNEVIQRRCSENILNHVDMNGTQLCNNGCPLAQTLIDGQSRETDVFLHHKEGFRIPIQIHVAPVYDEKGIIIGAVESFSDNTEKMASLQLVEELQREAFLDPLTGLANRRYLMESIESILSEVKRYGWSFGLMILDLDHFKAVNDTYGHATGDEMLRTVTTTLARSMRASDLVGRYGGEEFIVLVRNVTSNQLLAIANKIKALVSTTRVHHGQEILSVTVSIGGALARPHDSSQALLGRADALLYESKAAGRNTVRIENQD